MTNRFDIIRVLMDTDAYKLDHRRQYPDGTTGVLSNFTNRGTRVPRVTHVAHFGLQAYLEASKEGWDKFFAADVEEVCSLYTEFVGSVLGPDAAAEIGNDHIRALHDKGYLPLVFSAMPEGTLVPLRVPSFTIENTEDDGYWLVNYLETVISSAYWQVSTSATTAYYFRKLLDEWAIKTTGTKAGVEFQGHDFSFRGMPGIFAAEASGAAHLLSFLGSDNLNAVNYVNDFYEGDNGFILGSVPATEHSVMCAGGNDSGDEQHTYERLLRIYPKGIVSVVSDTWDLWNVLTVILPNLKDQIMARDGKLVIRPDSGDPVDIITGTLKPGDALTQQVRTAYEWAPLKGVIEVLWDIFGGTVNEQGYKVLDPHIGSIYGDSISYDRAEEIFKRLEAKGFASTNIVFGVGSYTYQYVTRDTFASAIKATYVVIDGVGKEISKDPITDNGTKKSARGRIAVVRDDETGELTLVDGYRGAAIEAAGNSLLKPIWKNGKFITKQSFANVRAVLHPEGLTVA